MSANARQVGGNHYRDMASSDGEQHWDRMWRIAGRGYFIGQITRYAERYHLKNGIQDLDKIIHYTEKLKELEQAWINGTGPPPGDAGNKPLPNVDYSTPEEQEEKVVRLKSAVKVCGNMDRGLRCREPINHEGECDFQ